MGNNLTNTEQNGLRASEPQAAVENSTHHNLLSEFVNSAAYSGLEQPALGVAQFFGNAASKNVSGFFKEFDVEAPQADSSKSGWAAQTLGGAVGMLLPFALTKGALNKVGVFGEAASAESGLLSSRSALGLNLKESAYTGFAYGAILTPSKQTDSTGTLLTDRLMGGVGSAATFTTLTAGSIGLGRLSETNMAAKFGVASALKNPIMSGMIAGLPGGVVSAEFDSLTKNHSFATTSELGQSMAGMALVGGVFGAKEVAAPRIAGGASFIADNLRSRFNTPDFVTATRLGSGTESDTTSPAPQNGDNQNQSSDKLVDPNGDQAILPNGDKPVSQNGDITTDNKQAVASETVAKPQPDLLPEEQTLLSQISKAKTIDDWRQASQQVEDLRPETGNWFSERLDAQAKSLNDTELNTLWPALLKEDPHQAYRIAKQVGKSRITDVWQNQLETVRQSGERDLATQLGNTLPFLEPSAQLEGLNALLNLENPPGGLNMSASLLSEQNQIPAAKTLLDHGVQPYFELSKVNSADWAKWVFDVAPGEQRDGLVNQLSKKVAGLGSTPEQVNQIYRIAQDKATPAEFESLRGMMKGIDPVMGTGDNTAARQVAFDGLNTQFISRLLFHESNWSAADTIAQTHPDLVKALAVNSRLNGNLSRNEFLSSLMTSEPPITPAKLADSLTTLAKEAADAGRRFPLSYGDLEALAQHAVTVAPNEVAPLLGKLREDALQTLALDQTGTQDISAARLLTDMTLAGAFAKNNPELFQTDFKEPIEQNMADSDLSYDRRLEAARVLGELQRGGYDSAQAIHMPDLRMSKLADLTSEQQAQLRETTETALQNRSAMTDLLGDGTLGRLMPSVFGHASEGGIVGRQQHQVHDSTVDVHLLDVLEKANNDPRFKDLLPKDQVNTLWASFLHDVAKRENMVDLDHGWTSVSTAWGVLRTLGYPESQIQRITDIMGRDFDLSYDPDHKNSDRFADQAVLDDVVTSYRKPGALDAVSILNASDIQSVKADGSWYTPGVIAELEKVRSMAQDRIDQLNKHLLPVMTTDLPKGFGISELSDYNVMAHTSPDLTGQLLRHRSTIESPEFSMSVSLLNQDHQKLYSDESPVVALVNGPFEHIAQAHRGNLSTGQSVGWDGHVELVRRWATDYRAERLAAEAESKLAALNIPPDSQTAQANYPRLAHMRKILSQFDSLDELVKAAGPNNQYVEAANEINQMLTTDKDGGELNTHNEIKINNPILSGIGIVRKPNQTVYFEGVPDRTLQTLWHGQVPDYVRSIEPGGAPEGAVVVKPDVVNAAQANNLPIVILNGRN